MKTQLQEIIDLLDESEAKKVYSGLDLIIGKKIKEIEERKEERYRRIKTDLGEQFKKKISITSEYCAEGNLVDLEWLYLLLTLVIEISKEDHDIAREVFLDIAREDKRLEIWEAEHNDELDIIAIAANKFKDPIEAMQSKKYVKIT